MSIFSDANFTKSTKEKRRISFYGTRRAETLASHRHNTSSATRQVIIKMHQIGLQFQHSMPIPCGRSCQPLIIQTAKVIPAKKYDRDDEDDEKVTWKMTNTTVKRMEELVC